MRYYVVNKENKVVAQCGYVPDAKDLKSRDEFAVVSDEGIPLEKAAYDGTNIVVRDMTEEEKVDVIYRKKARVDGLIDHYTRKQFKVLLEREGLLDDNLKQLWKERDELAVQEDIAAASIGQQEDARAHDKGE